MVRLKTILSEHSLNTMPKAVLKRLDFINEKCLALGLALGLVVTRSVSLNIARCGILNIH